MPITFERSILESAGSLRVNIPKEVATYLGIKKGDTVSIYVNNGQMILEKKKD